MSTKSKEETTEKKEIEGEEALVKEGSQNIENEDIISETIKQQSEAEVNHQNPNLTRTDRVEFEWKGFLRSNRTGQQNKYFLRTEGFCKDDSIRRLQQEIVKDIERRAGFKRTPHQRTCFSLILVIAILIMVISTIFAIIIKSSAGSVIVAILGYVIGIPLIICAFAYKHNNKAYGKNSSLKKSTSLWRKMESFLLKE